VRKTLIALAIAAAASLAAHVAPAQDTKPAPAPAPDAAAAAAATALAAACMKLPEADCGATSGCVWLPGYKVASGEEVPGYCRSAPKPLTARRRPTVEGEQPK
jgi:hypothetical protein